MTVNDLSFKYCFTMRYIYIPFLILSVYFTGCNGDANRESVDSLALKINIDTIQVDWGNVSLNTIQYIPLETSDSCLIGSIDKMLFFNNLIYVSDFLDNKTLLIYTREGKFVKRINIPGRGPGEYLQPIDFDIDPMGNIRILDNGLKKILTFSSMGEYIKEEKTDLRFLEFFWGSDDQFMFNYQFDTEKEAICLGSYNLKEKTIETLIPSRGILDDISIMRQPFYFFKSDNTVIFNPRFTNILYKLSSEDKVDELIELVSEDFPNEEFVREYRSNRHLGDIFPDKILDITDIYETSDFYYLRVVRGKHVSQNILYSKKTNNISGFRLLKNENYIGSGYINGVAKDMFISTLPPSFFVNKPDWKERVQNLNIDNITKSRLLGLTIESNPVIIFFNFSKF